MCDPKKLKHSKVERICMVFVKKLTFASTPWIKSIKVVKMKASLTSRNKLTSEMETVVQFINLGCCVCVLFDVVLNVGQVKKNFWKMCR